MLQRYLKRWKIIIINMWYCPTFSLVCLAKNVSCVIDGIMMTFKWTTYKMYDIYKLPNIYKNIRFYQYDNIQYASTWLWWWCYITEGFRFQEVYHFTLIIFQLFICFDLLFDIYSMNELLMRFNEMNVKCSFFLRADKMFFCIIKI